MKKLFFVLVSVSFFLFACDLDKTLHDALGSGSFSPPSFVIGDWESTTPKVTFSFTKSNIIYTEGASSKSIDFAKEFKKATVDENIEAGKTYEVIISILGKVVGSYKFETSGDDLDYYLKATNAKSYQKIATLTKKS